MADTAGNLNSKMAEYLNMAVFLKLTIWRLCGKFKFQDGGHAESLNCNMVVYLNFK
jgi:hypothetical protein